MRYVSKEPAASTWPQIVGLAVHSAAEKILKDPTEDPQDALTFAFAAEMQKGPLDGAEPASVALATAQRAFAAYLAAGLGKPVYVEQPFEIEIEGIGFSGTIDRVDEWADGLALRDLKTAANRPQGERYRRQLTGYAMGLATIDERPILVMIVDAIVLTKTAYYWPIYLDPPDVDDQRLFAATLEGAANGIERGDYAPTGLGTYACNMCSYRNICGPYQRAKGD